MGETEAVVHKHLKASLATPSDPPPGRWDAVRSRASAATPQVLAVAWAGGASASVTAVVTHQSSAVAAIGACAFAVGCIASCVHRYIERKPAITDAKSKAQSRKIRAETQQSLMLKAADDPTKAPAIERMLVLQNQAALIDEAEKLGEQAVALATHLPGQRPSRQPGRNPPGNKGGGFPRAV